MGGSVDSSAATWPLISAPPASHGWPSGHAQDPAQQPERLSSPCASSLILEIETSAFTLNHIPCSFVYFFILKQGLSKSLSFSGWA